MTQPQLHVQRTQRAISSDLRDLAELPVPSMRKVAAAMRALGFTTEAAKFDALGDEWEREARKTGGDRG